MIEKNDIAAGHIVDFRLNEKGDDQPDFTSAFQYLGQVVTAPGQWLPYHGTPIFEVREIHGRPIYVIKIWASSEALNLLKWRDVETEDLRILDDYPPSNADVLAINAANESKLSGG